jgi:hypothetical protein
MIEQQVDLWSVDCDARCITTNGTIKADGRAVMGRGVALQACGIYLGLRKIQGRALMQHGNVPTILLPDARPIVVSFPVKHVWSDWADLALIRQSAERLVLLTTKEDWRRVALPRPGCNNGKRHWAAEVRPILLPLLDDRFIVVHQ